MTIRTAEEMRKAAAIVRYRVEAEDREYNERFIPASSEWRPISEAVEDPTVTIEVYAPDREGLGPIVTLCNWHPSAGWCIDELRDVTHWRPHVKPGGTP